MCVLFAILLYLQFLSALAAPALNSTATACQFTSNIKSNSSDTIPLIFVPPGYIDLHSNLSIVNHDDDEYTVPGTEVTLSIGYWPDRDIDRNRLGNCLRQMQLQVTRHIEEHGDGPLADHDDDPYRRQGAGFYFIAKSTPDRMTEHQLLTYQSLLDTLIGLFDVMFSAHKPWASYTNIEHATLGLLGTAVVLPGLPTEGLGLSVATA